MTSWYPLEPHIDLHVKERIAKRDADRQLHTAREILIRLHDRPGLILADEVGMGKTFVGLAVATSVTLADRRRRPVVVMVPSSLREKWPADFELFREKCLPAHLAEEVRGARANRAVEFLKCLDDPPRQRPSIIFLTHGAMSHGLNDGWVKLALIYRAMYHRRNAGGLRRALCRVMGRLLRMGWVDRKDPDIWPKLLATPPEHWLGLMQARGFDPEGRETSEGADDPVPEAVTKVLWGLDVDELYNVLTENVPRRESRYFERNLKVARHQIAQEIRRVWRECVNSIKFKLPLLVLDEAHHLKNDQTRLASLFQAEDARDDADDISRGPLSDVFERMLFLTATPFQLGHHELCSVLDRFNGISWHVKTAPPIGRDGYQGEIAEVRARLDRAQEAAVAFDDAWGRLEYADLTVGESQFGDVEAWWQVAIEAAKLTPVAKNVVAWHRKTCARMREAEIVLRPWLIRHLRPRQLPPPHERTARRTRLPGRAIVEATNGQEPRGISIEGRSLLPFLLAARATACTPESRPVFAEGLASSYEAFLHTRTQRLKGKDGDDAITDSDDDAVANGLVNDQARWYLDKLYGVLPRDRSGALPSHPKLSATVRRIVDTWRQGEKVVVFCHYVATGRALRRWISEGIAEQIRTMASERMRCSLDVANRELERFGERFFDQDSPIRRACDAEVRSILQEYPSIRDDGDVWGDIVRRNLRTPAFLVRYFPLDHERLTAISMLQALEQRDLSGLSLRELLHRFFDFLEHRCGARDRERYRDAMMGIQTGAHFGTKVRGTFESDELQGEPSGGLLPNVRLVNGSTGQDTRQRLMLTFNTPFYPEVLVASSVMAEGVDLQLNCRYVIHHDLCWNPSTLEQRTGRVDRIGAKVECCGKPIQVYIPYVAETQDEKMYRVVMDRERWFNVVMGEQYRVDARSTDRMAQRIPLPDIVAEDLPFRLSVVDSGDGAGDVEVLGNPSAPERIGEAV